MASPYRKDHAPRPGCFFATSTRRPHLPFFSRRLPRVLAAALVLAARDLLGGSLPASPRDPNQASERTCFQTGQPWSGIGNLCSDVAIVYGIDPGLASRIQSWRDHGYRIHVMTGVAWGQYQDYLYGRFEPSPSDPHLSQVYGLALPLLKRGIPVTPVQLENVIVPDYLKGFRVLLLTYNGMKPLDEKVHESLADWVKHGGVLVVCDSDADPYNAVREWWNSAGRHYRTPRENLFERLGFGAASSEALAKATPLPVRHGAVIWLRRDPPTLVAQPEAEIPLIDAVRRGAARCGLKWRETNYLQLRRGPYTVAAGLDESIPGSAAQLHGRFVNLFDPELRVRQTVELSPGSRYFLLDLDAVRERGPRVLAAACKTLIAKAEPHSLVLSVEGVADTPAVALLRITKAPRSVFLKNKALSDWEYSASEHLLWLRFANAPEPQELTVNF